MKRDGANKSIWQANFSDYSPKLPSLQNKVFDVVIAGAGITGLTTGLLLQKAGLSCLIAEAQTIGFGTTGGTTAHLNTMLDTSYPELIKDYGIEKAKLISLAVNEAVNLVRNLVSDYSIDCDFKDVSGYLFSTNDSQSKDLEDILRSSQEVGEKITYVNNIPIPIPFQQALEFQGQGQLHATKYLFALAKEFENLGGILVTNCRILDYKSGDQLVIRSTSGDIVSKNLIYATHIPPGISPLHFECAPYRSYVLGVELEDENYPSSLVYDLEDPFHYFRTQEIEGKKYLIVGGEDHKTGHIENTEICFQNLESFVRKYFKVKNITYKWSAQYYEPVDGIPFIGRAPLSGDNVFVATGFSGNGITYGSLSALILFDLLINNSSKYDQVFTPRRINIKAGFSDLITDSATVVKDFFIDWLSINTIKAFDEVKIEEGRIVKYDGKALAIYKDKDASIHAMNPACTHMKCSVHWNHSEKSWDCPCHGSRFHTDGTVLTGPAIKDLQKIEIKADNS